MKQKSLASFHSDNRQSKIENLKWDQEFDEASPVLRFMIASLLQFLRKLYKKAFKSWIAK